MDHELSYEFDGSQPLRAQIERVLKESESKELASAPPLDVELYSEPAPEPATVRVRHKKFGEGTVVAQLDGTVTVDFDDVGEKRLKASFLTFVS